MMSSEEHSFKDTGHSLNINEYECVIGSLTYPWIYQPIFANDAWQQVYIKPFSGQLDYKDG